MQCDFFFYPIIYQPRILYNATPLLGLLWALMSYSPVWTQPLRAAAQQQASYTEPFRAKPPVNVLTLRPSLSYSSHHLVLLTRYELHILPLFLFFSFNFSMPSWRVSMTYTLRATQCDLLLCPYIYQPKILHSARCALWSLMSLAVLQPCLNSTSPSCFSTASQLHLTILHDASHYSTWYVMSTSLDYVMFCETAVHFGHCICPLVLVISPCSFHWRARLTVLILVTQREFVFSNHVQLHHPTIILWRMVITWRDITSLPD